MEQRAFRLHEMERKLAAVPGDRDAYMSQAFFDRPCRRALHLRWLTHAFVDLDLYNLRIPPDPGQGGIMLRMFCRDEGIPEPSVIVSSGQGRLPEVDVVQPAATGGRRPRRGSQQSARPPLLPMGRRPGRRRREPDPARRRHPQHQERHPRRGDLGGPSGTGSR